MADLAAFLSELTASASEQWHWPGIDQHFDVVGYLTDREPPLELVVSVRAVALRGDQVFVFESEGETHAVPGGRREPGESPDAALIRELLEETGCTIVGTPRRLAVLHLRSLSARRHDPKYTYPYPDTIQWIFIADVTGDAIPSDDPFVDNGRFVSVESARRSVHSVTERMLLDAAVASR